MKYYTEKITSEPKWKLVGIFADKGISGTSTKNRDEFNKMIRACKRGKIDMIITKSISRFARNTVDCLKYIRLLKELNVDVFFEEQGIHSIDVGSEFYITVYGSLAQSESENISANVKWGKERSAKEGKVGFQYKNSIGYRKGEDGKPEIVPEEAETIKYIYQLFLKGESVRMIKESLEKKRILSPSGKKIWSCATISNILTNEKYKGDIYLYDSERDSFMMALKNLGYSMNTENEEELNEAYEWLKTCVETMDAEIVTDEIIDNMAQARKAMGLIYSGDAAYVMSENEDMGFYLPSEGTNLWCDAMVIPSNAKNVELAHEFINYMSNYDQALENSDYVGYTSPNEEVIATLSGEGGTYEGINAYIPRSGYEKDENFYFNEDTRKIISNLWSKVKMGARNAN